VASVNEACIPNVEGCHPILFLTTIHGQLMTRNQGQTGILQARQEQDGDSQSVASEVPNRKNSNRRGDERPASQRANAKGLSVTACQLRRHNRT
jgi:hypothetical protein